MSGSDRHPGAVDLPSGWRLHAFDEVGSTNVEALALGEQGAPEGTTVWALRQNAGRGRRGRARVSPQGNLFASFLLRPRVRSGEAALLSFVASLAVAEAVEAMGAGRGPVPGLKWPNDVLLEGRKTSGILLESRTGSDPDRVDFVVAGIGINLAAHPEDVERPTTSLAAHGVSVAPGEALGHLARALARTYARWCSEGFEPIRQAWLDRAIGVGEPILVQLAQERFEGVFETLGPDGALMVRLAEGGVRPVHAGDVFPLGAPVRH